MSKSARQIIRRLESKDPYTPGPNTITGCEYVALQLFQLICENHGEGEARRIFAMWGTPPSRRRVGQFSNWGLLDRLDRMQPKPNIQRLAREIAAENKNKQPRERPRGPAGNINAFALDRHIRHLCKQRKDAMNEGAWWGPIPGPHLRYYKLADHEGGQP